MKQLSNQKWILSTLLFAALGSQYYFSISSKNGGYIEMSSEPAVSVEKPTSAAIEMAAILNSIKSPVPVAIASSDTTKQKTEAITTAAPCADCVILTKAEAEKIRQILIEVTGKKATADDEIAETPSEKLKREREERAAKRDEEKLAKVEKAKEAQELRDEKFRDEFERLSSRCSDVECYSSSLASALNRYTDKSKLISSKVVTEIYNEHIAKDLKNGLKDPEDSSAQAALETLMAEIPMSYKSIKTKTIDMAKALAAPKAVEANASFKQAEELRKANKLNESSAAFSRGVEQKAELQKMLSSHQEAIKDGTEQAEDKATYAYYNLNYAKPASQWLADIMNSTSFTTGEVDSNQSSVSVNPNESRGVVRGGNGNTTVGSPLNNNIGSKMSAPGTNNPGNVNFGSPQQQGTRGGRGSY